MKEPKQKENQKQGKKRKKTHRFVILRIHEYTGYARSYISKVISGRHSNPMIESLYKLSQEDFLKFLEVTDLRKYN